MSAQPVGQLAENLARVRRVRATVEAGAGDIWVVRIRGYGSRLIPSDLAAAEALTAGESISVRLEPLRGDSSAYRNPLKVAPLDTTSHPHC